MGRRRGDERAHDCRRAGGQKINWAIGHLDRSQKTAGPPMTDSSTATRTTRFWTPPPTPRYLMTMQKSVITEDQAAAHCTTLE
jgi:hypothetical protein